ncbi:unnamed protein product, partial [Mesorhabditis belari]|uniref:Uncharacterized protein n=1 Tax=Mesorhabditis belari TaxID=2138241 RepID=A0AAF3JBQ8_9BILA
MKGGVKWNGNYTSLLPDVAAQICAESGAKHKTTAGRVIERKAEAKYKKTDKYTTKTAAYKPIRRQIDSLRCSISAHKDQKKYCLVCKHVYCCHGHTTTN